MDNKTEYSETQIQTANFAKALSHPARVFIIEKLSKMNSCCYSGDLVEELPIGRSTLSLHLKELKHAGLIQGTTEPPYIKYCLNKENWETAKKLCLDLFAE
jgi:predicted transcriptional regulator